jgi:hypothetical protein
MNQQTIDYLQDYRKKTADLALLKSQIHVLEQDLMNKNHQVQDMLYEIDSMRKIITLMIDNDWDPVETKLRSEPSERQKNHWGYASDYSELSHLAHKSINNKNIYYNHQGCHYSGATGAIGALGSSSVPNLSYQSTTIIAKQITP